MAVCTVVASGNYSDAGTWDTPPTSVDDVVLSAEHVLTVDVDSTCATMAVYGRGEVVIDTDKKLTITSTSTWGGAAPRLGKLTFRAGAELSIGGTMTLGAILMTTSGTTKEKPAKLSGAGNVAHPATYRSRIALTHFVLANDSTFSLAIGSNGASILTEAEAAIIFTDAVFLPGGTAVLGSANSSIDLPHNELLRCDIRDRSVDFSGSLCTVKRFRQCTFRSTSTRKNFRLLGDDVTELCNDNVFIDTYLQSSGGATVRAEENLFVQILGGDGDNICTMGGAENRAGAIIKRNYAYTSVVNSHGFGGGSLSSKNIFSENVIETSPTIIGGPNLFTIGIGEQEITKNLVIGKAVNLVGSAGNITGNGVSVFQNTVFGVSDSSLNDPLLYLVEQGTGDNYTGDEIIHSNLVSLSTSTPAGSSGGLVGGSGAANDTFHMVGYNATHNLTGTKYVYQTLTNNLTANDVTLSESPGFIDPSRNLAKWGETFYSTDGSFNAVIELFLSSNGYDATAQKQTAEPFTGKVGDLVDWVRAGFAPTNAALLNAGYDGVTIGAMEYVSADDTAPVLTDATATATGPTTATATVTTDDGNGTLYFLASTNATESASTVKAALSQSVTATGEQSISLSALDPGTTYYVHFVQINGAGLESASVVSTAAFTTDAIAVKGATITLYAGITPQASITDIVALWWDATTPSGAPDYSTTTASTDASGVLTLDLDAATSLSIGDSGFLLLYKLDATDHRNSLVFAGRVAVSDVS